MIGTEIEIVPGTDMGTERRRETATEKKIAATEIVSETASGNATVTATEIEIDIAETIKTGTETIERTVTPQTARLLQQQFPFPTTLVACLHALK